jgi:NADH:ubiquinone oxidoreductase subunit 5 (subunit L)/multisubunit Na+/H+ antiporter MnhA subunit
MFISLSSLIVLSITSGYLFSDMFLGYGSSFFNNSIFIFTNHFNFLEIEFIHPIIKNLPVIFCVLFSIIFIIIFETLTYNNFFGYTTKLFFILRKISPFFYYAMFFDKLYNSIYKIILIYTYLVSSKYIDKGILELIGP